VTGSPFQPDAASDWWNFGVSLLAALATIAAVLFAVRSSRQADARAEAARADARIAQEDAKKAQERAEAADERAIQAAERQAAASERISATELELEQERRDYARRADLERKAQRQAVDLSVSTDWESFSKPDEPLEDGYVVVYVDVRNGSTSVMRDLVARLDTYFFADEPRIGRATSLAPGTMATVFQGPRYLPGVPIGTQLAVTVAFTDSYGDRWQRAPDGSLTLLTVRSIEQAPPGFEELA